MKRFLLTGHVDHGKSTLGGRLLYECGALEVREAQKVFEEAERDRMSSFRWARLLDTDATEMERGITVDCIEADFEFRGQQIRLIDTPGHKLFIRHLIEAIYRNTGSKEGGVVGVLVLSALPNELEPSLAAGQVKEDLLLLRAIGIASLVVAVNKLDKLAWDASAFETAKSKVLPLLKAARFKEVRFAATSGWEGRGLLDTASFVGAPPPLLDSILALAVPSAICKLAPAGEPVAQIAANIFVLSCPLFSAGYEGVVHGTWGEANFCVERIEKAGSPRAVFLKSGDKGLVTLTLSEKVAVGQGERIILRTSGQTVGYGLVV